MKRKLFIIFLSIACALCLCFGLTACGNGNSNKGENQNNEQSENGSGGSSGNTGTEESGGGETSSETDGGSSGTEESGGSQTHTHSFTKVEAVAATCTTDGNTAYYYCSGCKKYFSDEAGTTEITLASTVIAATGIHTYGDDNICTVCGDKKASEGLNYTFSDEDNTYTVSGIGTCTDTDIVIPSTYNGYLVTSIGEKAFFYCTSPTSVTIGSGVTSIGKYAFNYCTALASVTIPDSVETIGSGAFNDCKSLTSITIPDSVIKIGSSAFSGCTALTEINFNATAMDDLSSSNYVFYEAGQSGDGITVTIGANVTKIPAYLFYDSKYIISIVFEDDSICESIGNSAFYNCTSLTSITIPNGVTSIGSQAFYNCISLASITIGSGVTTIGSYAFYNTAYYNETNNWENNVLYIGNYLIAANTKISGEYSIKDGTTVIAPYAFSGCTLLISIIIPNSVTSIEFAVFYNCTSLESINIPDGVTFIGNSAFSYCTSLESITIPDSVTSIGRYAFSGCTSLTSVIIGSGVTSIGEEAFSYCTSLASVYYNGTASQWASISFDSGSANPLYNGGNLYLNGTLVTEIMLEGITTINDYAFRNCTSITSITIPDSVTSIGSYAFWYCTSLTSITIGSDVTFIGNYAFNGCTSLESVYYNGTAVEWSAISIISNGNSYLTSAMLYYYSESQPTDSGNYWHYVDGEIVVWTVE